MGQYDKTLGPLLLGTFFNTFLYGLAFYQYTRYYGSGFKDPLWIRITVVALCILDTFHSFLEIYMIWQYCIMNYDNPKFVGAATWAFKFTTVGVVLVAGITHNFLCYRVWRLTENVYIYALVILLAVATFCLGMACGIQILQVKIVLRGPSFKLQFGAWLILQTTTDILITIILGATFYRSRTGLRNTDNVIKRLIRNAIQTGLFPSVCATALLLFYLFSNTNWRMIFGLPTGRIYTITLMDTLLVREGLKEQMSGTQFLKTFWISPSLQQSQQTGVEDSMELASMNQEYGHPNIPESSSLTKVTHPPV